jgi:hypothetical protein
MQIVFSGTVPKEPAYPDAAEDNYDTDNARVLAVSDGASESFDSRTWARLLVSRYVASQEVNLEWLEAAVNQYEAEYATAPLTWSQQAAFERGSFATLLGVVHDPENGALEVLAIGDTVAVLLESSDFQASFLVERAAQLDQRPELLSTLSRHNQFVSEVRFFGQHSKVWSLTDRRTPALLCMTDTLAAWALRAHENQEPKWTALLEIESQEQMERLVLEERQSGRLKVDDCTLIRVIFP